MMWGELARKSVRKRGIEVMLSIVSCTFVHCVVVLSCASTEKRCYEKAYKSHKRQVGRAGLGPTLVHRSFYPTFIIILFLKTRMC